MLRVLQWKYIQLELNLQQGVGSTSPFSDRQEKTKQVKNKVTIQMMDRLIL